MAGCSVKPLEEAALSLFPPAEKEQTNSSAALVRPHLEETGPSLLQAQMALAALGDLRGQDVHAAKLLAELAA